jgi:hypothetical protein
MKRLKFLQAMAAAIACLGMLVPATPVCGQPPPGSARPPMGSSCPIGDIALGEQGTLVGQVVNPQGTAVAGASVSIRQMDREVARTTTDGSGYFAASGLRGGVYAIATAQSSTVLRLWTATTAPPSSQRAALIVDGGVQVRGQVVVGRVLGNPWVLTGLVTSAIAIPVVLNNTGEPSSP